MSAPAFTPGPWALRKYGELDGTFMYFIHENGNVGLSACADNEADIPLIAAAPELYEALEKCRALLLPNTDRAIAGQVDAVLAKARGEQ